MNNEFTFVQRLLGDRWLHKSGIMWIVYYPMAPGGPIYQAYAVCEYELPIPARRDPWTLNHSRLDPKGFKTFEEAASAIQRRTTQ